MSRRDSAVALARLDLAVFPCGTPTPGHPHPPGSKGDCPRCKAEKAPRRGWEWGDRNSSDPDEVAAGWPADDPNIGVACKPSGLLVVDLDQHHPDADGIEAFQQLCEAREVEWPRTFTVRTSSGGCHLYYRAPAGRPLGNSAGRLAPGIDTRGPGKGNHGGYVVGPGSIVGDSRYEVTRDVPVQPLPDWIADILDPPQSMHRPARYGPMPKAGGPYAAAALRNSIERLLATEPGNGRPAQGRNHALNATAYSLGRLVGAGILDATTVTTALERAAEAIGLTAEDGPRQTAATIRSGLTTGMANPRHVKGGR
ncbi:MAG TPA: bifunctional DNA primase/polymerase [Candidatus Limnocylindrales bacterium]